MTTKKTTKEKQYNKLLEYQETNGLGSLGLMSNQCWEDDPRRFIFMLSRYKFVSKLLSGFNNVLEVGCGDAFASRIVLQEVNNLTVADFDPIFIEDILDRGVNNKWKMKALCNDFIKQSIPKKFDGIYSLDVLEHIETKKEGKFIGNILKSLNKNGVLIFGMPTLESQVYASKISKEGHVNCKTSPKLKELMLNYFNTVFMFSMNDEVVHTGFHKMSHYIFAVCSNKK